MKKNLFLILISTLFILILLYFYDEREVILNREYIDKENDIYIEYPYFNDQIIDEKINSYLNNFIDSSTFLERSLFIDYDYQEYMNKIELMMYVFEEKENMIRKKNMGFMIDMNRSEITGVSNIIETDLEYDGYMQKVIEKSKPMIALTFDDGPNHNTIEILDVLEQYGIKATFFILGTNIAGNEKIIKRMNELGMEIGNHMYSHKLITKLSDDAIKKEVKKVDDLIFNVTGAYPTLVRPSYGTYNKRMKSLIDRPIIIWNVDTLDWKYHNSKRIANKIMKNISDGDIVLMHDIYSATVNGLKIVIPELLEKGYQFVTVSELLYYKGIEIEGGMVYSHVN